MRNLADLIGLAAYLAVVSGELPDGALLSAAYLAGTGPRADEQESPYLRVVAKNDEAVRDIAERSDDRDAAAA